MAMTDDVVGLVDIYEGDFTQSGELNLDNVASGTTYLYDDQAVHTRVKYAVGKQGTPQIVIENSVDAGTTWIPNSMFSLAHAQTIDVVGQLLPQGQASFGAVGL